jgi:hypothetical protein
MQKEKYVENPYAEIWFENGVIYTVFKPNTVITMEVAERVTEDRIKVSEGRTLPIFIDLRNMVSTENAARAYMASKSAQKFISAGAILINNEIHRLLTNLWLKIDRPIIPTKSFTEKEKALQWLERYKFQN